MVNLVDSKKKVYELTGIIKCGVCDNKGYLGATSGTSKTGKTYWYYKCKECGLKIGAEEVEKSFYLNYHNYLKTQK